MYVCVFYFTYQHLFFDPSFFRFSFFEFRFFLLCVSHLSFLLSPSLFSCFQPILEDLAGAFASDSSNSNNGIDGIDENDIKIKIGKVDATKSKKIAKELSVRSFPTIKYVKNGIINDYTGIRTKERFLSFLKLMVKDSITVIKSLSELQNLHVTNVISDSSPNNIIFLLNIIFNKKENEKEKKTKIENVFEQLALKYQGKGIFVVLKTVKKKEKEKDDDDSWVINDDNMNFSISKIEMNAAPIMLEVKNNLDIKNVSSDNNNNNIEVEVENENEDEVNFDHNNLMKKIDKNLITSKMKISYNQIEEFFVKNNHPIISELSQRNFKVFSESKRIVIIAVVNAKEISNKNDVINTNIVSNIDDISDKQNKENNSKNEKIKNISEIYEKNLKNFEIVVLEKKMKKKMNNYIFGYLDCERWKRFLLQYGITEPGLLIIDFRSENLVFHSQKFHTEEKDKIYDKINDVKSNNNIENYDMQQQEKIRNIFLDLINEKLEFSKKKKFTEKIVRRISDLKKKFYNYLPYSLFLVFIFVIFVLSLFLPSPSIVASNKMKKS